MEPNWTKSISNEDICSLYYYYFIITAVASGIFILTSVFTMFMMITNSKLRRIEIGLSLITTSLSGIFAFIMSLFLFLVCDRALLQK